MRFSYIVWWSGLYSCMYTLDQVVPIYLDMQPSLWVPVTCECCLCDSFVDMGK